jgi:hypothetical protein
MISVADRPPRKLVVFKKAGSIALLFLLIVGSLLLLPAVPLAAEDSPQVTRLKQKAQAAFLKSDYKDAVASDLEIAQKYPHSEARRYAVQMLGTLYENNIVDLKSAIKWDQEFLDKYADSRQAPVYKDKLASLAKLVNQEQAFKTYQSIQFAHEGDAAMVKKSEALLKEHPGFLLKDKVESDLAYAYDRMDQRKKSALAFQTIASEGGEKLSSSDKVAYETESRYWRMRTTWAWVAWALIATLWATVLWMKPWKELTWAKTRRFLLWPILWLIVTGASMPLFFSMETKGYPIVIPFTTVLVAIGLNLTILFWLLLLISGKYWQTRRLARWWLSPALTLLMTAGVFYLYVVYQPNGPFIVDVCVVKYDYWRGELREWTIRHRAQQHSAKEQSNRPPASPEKPAAN